MCVGPRQPVGCGPGEIFPLPYFLEDGSVLVSKSRRCAQRLGRKSAVLRRCNAAVFSLNALSGVPASALGKNLYPLLQLVRLVAS